MDLNKVLDNIDTKIESYTAIKDTIGISDILEVLDDGLAIFRGMNTLAKYISKKRFAYFLKGLGKNDEDLDESMKKLYSYINSESKAEFITKIIDKVLKSNSKKAAFLLGILSSELMSTQKEFDYKDIICVSSLGELYDYDFDNLISVWKYIDDETARYRRTEWFSVGNHFKTWGGKNNLDINDSIELTIEKCVALQLIIKDFESDIDIDEDSPEDATVDTTEAYKFTNVGMQLKNYCRYLHELDI
jgi:hypothetical protein